MVSIPICLGCAILFHNVVATLLIEDTRYVLTLKFLLIISTFKMLLMLPLNIIQSTDAIYEYFETGSRTGRALKTAVVLSIFFLDLLTTLGRTRKTNEIDIGWLKRCGCCS